MVANIIPARNEAANLLEKRKHIFSLGQVKKKKKRQSRWDQCIELSPEFFAFLSSNNDSTRMPFKSPGKNITGSCKTLLPKIWEIWGKKVTSFNVIINYICEN